MQRRFVNNAGFLVTIMSILVGLILIITSIVNLVKLSKISADAIEPFAKTFASSLLLLGGLIILGGIILASVLFSLGRIIELLEEKNNKEN